MLAQYSEKFPSSFQKQLIALVSMKKKCYNVMFSRQEGSMVCHLVTAHYDQVVPVHCTSCSGGEPGCTDLYSQLTNKLDVLMQ